MKRPASKLVFAATAFGVILIVLASVRVALRRGAPQGDDALPCGSGFFRQGARCCPTSVAAPGAGGLCVVGPPASCPGLLVATPRGCDAPERSVVLVPETLVQIGPADWEAEGRVRPRTVHAGPFSMDRLEVTCGALGREDSDPGRAASGISLPEARAICARRGGRLPTEDEWIVAAAGEGPRRYPWGDTGAVCRRAAWGLTRGPCGNAATGPDTVGAHPDGATPLGIQDLAGNVAEWVETGRCAAPDVGDCRGVVRGGSYATDLATDLRTWGRREVPAAAHEATVGVRCAYDLTR